ncbi:MAG: type 1 glutamine amidotransferase [Elusimicrobia bacterium]|nr:type 1 glutamine amidotransferase [Elusimicrobiota bacterium]
MGSLAGKKIAIIIERDFQDLEAWFPYLRLQEEGAVVEFVAPEKKEYAGKFGYPAMAERALRQVKPDDYDCLVIPGGFAPDFLRRYPPCIEFVRDAYAKGKLIASICHGPWILVSAGILKGKRATCFAAIAVDIQNAGAHYEDSEVVTDGRIITSRKPEDLPAFCRAIIKALGVRGQGSGVSKRKA